MSEENSADVRGLTPQYQNYTHQKCFVAFTKQAPWSDDLLAACQVVLSMPEFNLEIDYAGKHFDPDIPLRQKALELIANARYGIYDLSCWRDETGVWQMPRNVFIELGMAIALNRPTLLLHHVSNQESELPDCLKSMEGHMLNFGGKTTLKNALKVTLPRWVNAPPDRDWWNKYCIFGNRRCEYREAHPRLKQWGNRELASYISEGADPDRPDFRGIVEEVYGRYSGVTFKYANELPVARGYEFLLCAYCQITRSTPFAIYRITPFTGAETYIAIGISISLEAQFGYNIPRLLFTQKANDVPSLLSGFEVVAARNDREKKIHLQAFLPDVIKKVRKTSWKPRPLPFMEASIEPSLPVEKAGTRTPNFFLVSSDAVWSRLVEEIAKTMGTFQLQTEENTFSSKVLPGSIVIFDSSLVGDIENLAVRVRRLEPDLRIVVAAPSPTWMQARSAFRTGAADYFVKTTDREELRSILSELPQLPTQPRSVMVSKHNSRSVATILFVENDLDFLRTREELLEQEGYKVISANNPAEAKRKLTEMQPDLMITGVRLLNDYDENDRSGLDLAKEGAFAGIPKIILSAFLSSEIVKEVLRPAADGASIATHVVGKQEGAEAFLSAVRNILTRHSEESNTRSRRSPEETLLAEIFGDKSILGSRLDTTKQSKLKKQIRDVLGGLDDHERKVLEMRFGLRDGNVHTSIEVAQELREQTEVVRLVEMEALRKLRDFDTSQKLSDFLDPLNLPSDVTLGFKRFRVGDIVTGTIVSVEPREISIDIGATSNCVVEEKEFKSLSADAIRKLHVGDQILVYIVQSENLDGNVVVSLLRAQLERDWRDAEELLKSGQAFETQVLGFNKGGLVVRVGKVRGFVPATQLEGTYRRKIETPETTGSNELDLGAYVGKKVKLKVVELDRERNRLILSERAAQRELRKEQKERLLDDLKEGTAVTGTVTIVTDFGAFVDLGGVDGLIHLSELSWTKIAHPRDLLKVGDQIEVQVLGVDRDRERIALSLKRRQPEPWSTVEERYKVGQLVNGTITKLASFGAFARLEDNIEGLIHISELADRRIQHPKEVVKEGDKVALHVISVDPQRRRLMLSLKLASKD